MTRTITAAILLAMTVALAWGVFILIQFYNFCGGLSTAFPHCNFGAY